MNDEQLEKEIRTIQDIVRVRLRRYNRELKELERDLRELKSIQRARKRAELPVGAETPVTEEASP